MSEYNDRYFLSCPRGMEYLLEDELKYLWGHLNSERSLDSFPWFKTSPLGVMINCAPEFAYEICLWSRIANRVMYQILESRCESVEQLYSLVYAINWSEHMSERASFVVDFSGQSEFIRNSMFGAQKVKDALVDSLRDATGTRPIVSPENPDVRIRAHLRKGVISVYFDLSGASLHQRGYRTESGAAPLKENLAAGILYRSGFLEWLKHTKDFSFGLVDPMCGSGTLLIEAAQIACNRAPGLGRESWGLAHWKKFDETLWSRVLEQAQWRFQQAKDSVAMGFYGYDQDPKVIVTATRNAERGGVDHLLRLSARRMSDFRRPSTLSHALVVTNPPYGERLGEVAELGTLYAELGSAVRDAFTQQRGTEHEPLSAKLAVFSSNPELVRNLGFKVDKKYKFLNGKIPCELVISEVTDAAYQFGSKDNYQRGASWRITNEERAAMFGNRLKKNLKSLSKWLAKEGVSAYRLYDNDMPEYAVAIDCYGDWYHVQEYAPPKSVDPQSAKERFLEVLAIVRDVLSVDPEKIVYKRRERQKGSSQYQKAEVRDERIVVQEYSALFYVALKTYLDTGLFLDHRPIRKWIGENCRGKQVLNLFCYTGSVSVHAALGGAKEVVSVDMSNTYLNWAMDNFRLNHLPIKQHQFVRADCQRWLDAASGTFDVIFLDPPTFSNSKKMEGHLDIQRDHIALIRSCARLLSPGGVLIFSNNLRKFELDEHAITELGLKVENITAQTIDPDFKRSVGIHHCWRFTRQ